MSESKVFDEESVNTELKIRRLVKRSFMLQLEVIKLILEAGEAARSETFDFLVGKENIDRWIKDPESAEDKLKKLRAEILKEDNEINSLKARLNKHG